MSQTAIPVDESQPASGRCAWCEVPTSIRLVLQRGGLKTQSNGVKVRQPDLWAWVCPTHDQSLQRSKPAAATGSAIK